MTQEFFKGKQDRYPHPLRTFAIVMFLFLFFVNSLLKNKGLDNMTFATTETVVTPEGDTIKLSIEVALPIFSRTMVRAIVLSKASFAAGVRTSAGII